MQLIVEKKGYRLLPLLMLAIAAALLMLVARDTEATHNDGFVELDGNAAFNGGQGVDPGSGNCPYAYQAGPADGGAVDCIIAANAATFDWADDGNAGNGDQGVCTKDALNLITENITSPKGDQRKCVRDFVVGSTSDVSYHTGSDKDFQEIWDGSAADWGCVQLNNATNKSDLLNAYMVQVRPTSGPSAGHQLVFFGAERSSENGSVYNGFWFLQNPVSSDCPPSVDGDFCPDTTATESAATGCSNPSQHECGDVLILFNYDSGGRIGNIGAYQWDDSDMVPAAGVIPQHTKGCNGIDDGNAGDDCTSTQLANAETHSTPTGVLCIKTSSGLGDCRTVLTSFDDMCGRVNGITTCKIVPRNNDPSPPPCSGPGTVTTPWAPGCASGTNCTGGLASPVFSEAGVDLTGLGLEIGCVSAFVAESRSSPSVDATLKDYALGGFPACTLGWEKRDGSLSTHPLQGGATFTVTPNPYTGSGSLTVVDCVAAPCAAGGDTNAAAGVIDLPDVEPAAYTVCETVAPSGYALDDPACRNVTVSSANPSQSIGTQGTDDCAHTTPDEQDFCNRLGSIEWEKRDDQGALQGGATFTVGGTTGPFACHDANTTGADDDNPVTVLDNSAPDADTDAGQLKLDRVCLGTYTITETVPPTGFALDDDATRSVTVSSSALNQVVGTQGTNDIGDTDESDFGNRLGTIEWEKRSDVDGALLAGATFTVGGTTGPFACHDANTTGADDANPVTVVDNSAPDSDADGGQFKLDRVCLGAYTITETVAPAGYAIDPDATRACTVSASALACVVGSQGTADDCPDSNDADDNDEADFCNLVGSLFWEKRGKDASTAETGDELMRGSTFSVTGTGVNVTSITDCTSGPCAPGGDQDPDAGQFCLSVMPIGVALTITETGKPAGFIQTSPVDGSGNPTGITTTLTTSSTCTATPTDAGDFINTPLSKYQIKFICVAFSPTGSGECATRAQISCEVASGDEDGAADNSGAGGTPVWDDLDETYGNGTTTLLPGVYDCQVDIDP